MPDLGFESESPLTTASSVSPVPITHVWVGKPGTAPRWRRVTDGGLCSRVCAICLNPGLPCLTHTFPHSADTSGAPRSAPAGPDARGSTWGLKAPPGAYDWWKGLVGGRKSPDKCKITKQIISTLGMCMVSPFNTCELTHTYTHTHAHPVSLTPWPSLRVQGGLP